ncbi:MAG TPA: hypothetical protein VE338_02715 [Ktedonobacterales bacterium]|jgi:hypothetical protein|nr:hypothetical protein [Ktedonobacterales bacterium]
MDFEDFLEPEVGVAAAVVAVVASPQVRHVVRRGAVLGLAGVLMAGDAVTSFARGISHGASAATNGSSAPSNTTSTVPTVDASVTSEQVEYPEGEGANI